MPAWGLGWNPIAASERAAQGRPSARVDIARRVKISKSTVIRAIRHLRRVGLLTQGYRGTLSRGPSAYRVHPLAREPLRLTGLRKGELDSVTVRHLELDAPMPFAVLDAADEKAGRGAEISPRADVVSHLRERTHQ